MSTSCTFPKSVDSSFKIAKRAGFDGMEVMVSTEDATRSAATLRALSRKHDLPVLAIHAPVLFFTQFVWGTKPAVKLERSVELAYDCGADVVVVHPPFRWQGNYAQDFLEIVRRLEQTTGVKVAVENMFPWNIGGGSGRQAYLPGIDPTEMDCDSITLDFSHAALSGANALDLARAAGRRLQHVHLCDGQAPGQNGKKLWDEHLIPGQGGQPVAETLQYLDDINYTGHVVAEINTRPAKSETDRIRMLRQTVEFAHRYLRQH
ncbi:MAG: sugar phosphate isomerase/epimerase family protein [Gulosibacter sp.]|uniref:sugar phosphate isomerase/epimerase family protein n=1 Tax=Gulosibacter sp. TaxID=2817531 RepID=UPI003F903F4E